MTEFTKTKIAFVVAMLGTLFTLHPLIDRFGEWGYEYLGVRVRIFHVYVGLSALLGLAVYFYALVLSNGRPHSWAERVGNTLYSLALMVLPLYGGLYSVSLLSRQVGQSHLAWAAPIVAVSLGIVWLLISQVAAFVLRVRLGRRDGAASIEHLALRELASLARAKDLFVQEHYDLSVIEAWRALESRFRRVLLSHGVRCRDELPQSLLEAVRRARILTESATDLVSELRGHCDVAASTVPLTKEAAESALAITRGVLAMISVPQSHESARVVRAALSKGTRAKKAVIRNLGTGPLVSNACDMRGDGVRTSA